MSRSLFFGIGALVLTTTMWTLTLAQDAPEAKPSLKKAAGRLPAYYRDVVSNEQRDKIYGIQAKYNEQILKLAEEMKALTAKRDAEVEGVLTPEQKAKVETLRAEAAKNRAQATADKEAANAKPEE